MSKISLTDKLAILSDAAKYDASCASSGGEKRDSRKGGLGSAGGTGICHAYTPDGRCISLLKILMTNFCIFDCAYCINRVSSNVERARFSVEEVVSLTLEFYRRNYIEGLFLSSGIIKSPDQTMADMVRIARSLREDHQFRGYIHLKTIPDASPELIKEAGLWADRLSINVELPQDQSLKHFAPEKRPETIRGAMAQVRLEGEAAQEKSFTGKRARKFAPAGQSTQMIIGADGASDVTILQSSTRLYSSYKLRRVYYSAFSPIPDSSAALPLIQPPLLREHRLYQADWLLRFYGFSADEIATGTQNGNLDLELDPKLAWALQHRGLFPLDVNRAAKDLLLRVPGFGTRTVDRILAARRHQTLRYEDLQRMGALMKKARPFITLPGWTPRGLLDSHDLRARFAPPAPAIAAFVMYQVGLPQDARFENWREAARSAISHGIPPDALEWGAGTGLFAAPPLPRKIGPREVRVTAEFLKFARSVLPHRSEDRFHLLYLALWRHAQKDGSPLSPSDPLGRRLQLMAKSVRRDIHKMHAFLRFRELPAEGPRRRFAAWFEPDHYIVEAASGFFARRFADMDWHILTPDRSAIFEDGKLSFEAGRPRPDLPEDASEALWSTYFRNIFNPARVKLNAMRSEMPKKYWKNLPETRLIPEMLAEAEARVEKMRAAAPTLPRLGAEAVTTRYRASMPQIPDSISSLNDAKAAAQACSNCTLCQEATQLVWGEGAWDADLMIVGEQPGDREDLTARPFVGPAGQILRNVLAEQGAEADKFWLTNAVKHFKFQPRGKERLHKTPSRGEIDACQSWLALEQRLVAPKLLLALGRSAAYALTGSDAPLAPRRGQLEVTPEGRPVLISWHPSYLLRLPDPEARLQAEAEFRSDIAKALHLAQSLSASPDASEGNRSG